MKKCAITFIFAALSFAVHAQKYALIDETLAKPIQYVGSVSVTDVQNKFFPIERKELRQFLKVLTKIHKELKEEDRKHESKEFHLGCVAVKGTTVFVQNSPRISYNLIFNCDQVIAEYLLCDSKLKNATNAFIVNTWIKYIKSGLKGE